MESLVGGGNVTAERLADSLFGAADDVARRAFVTKFNNLHGASGGGLVVTEDAVRLVTKQERELHQAMMYCCQQSAFSAFTKFLALNVDSFGGTALSSQGGSQYTVNVVRSEGEPGYDVIVKGKLPIRCITGLDGTVTAYDSKQPPKVDFDVAFHIGWDGPNAGEGQPTFAVKDGHPMAVTYSTAAPVDKAELASSTRRIVARDGARLFADDPLAVKWLSTLPKAERDAFTDDVVTAYVSEVFSSKDRPSLVDAARNSLPWVICDRTQAHQKLAELEEFAAAHANAGDFYVRISSDDDQEFESAGTRNVLRTSASKQENNAIRVKLKTWVYAYYKGDVPESVLAEMTNFDGEGHPLSAKRIGRICAAIRRVREERLSEMEFLPGKKIGDISVVSPALADAFEAAVMTRQFTTDQRRRLMRLMAIAVNPNLRLPLDPANRDDFLSRLGMNNRQDHFERIISDLAKNIKLLAGGRQRLPLVTADDEPYEVTLTDAGEVEGLKG